MNHITTADELILILSHVREHGLTSLVEDKVLRGIERDGYIKEVVDPQGTSTKYELTELGVDVLELSHADSRIKQMPEQPSQFRMLRFIQKQKE